MQTSSEAAIKAGATRRRGYDTAVQMALVEGLRGLPGGSSLSKLLNEHVINRGGHWKRSEPS